MDSVFLIAATLLLGLNTLWGLYMRTRVIPTWFADMPRSFARIRTEAPKGWIPLQALFAITFIGALVLNWSNTTVRSLMLLTLLSYVIIVASTGIYFVKEILAFRSMPASTEMTPELRRRVGRWQSLTSLRNMLQVLGAALLVLACFYM